ncbi:MAG TPA: protein kinase [Kofleriaceae bacterium]|nr:protein kinase [Kofleriaceae bacterium]
MGGNAEQETAVLKMSAQTPSPRGTDERPAHAERTTIDPPPTTGSSTGSSLQALERDEILRSRAFSFLVMVLAIVGSIAAFVVPGGQPRGQLILVGGCALGFASMVFLLYQTLDPLRFRQPSTTLVWFLPAISVNAAVYYFGVFSPAVMLVVLGLYFVGLGKSGRMAIAAYVFCALLLLGMALVPITGGHDIGIMVPPLSTTQQIMIHVLTQFILALTIIIARLSRQSALVAVGELEQAVRLAAHRQALLLEARDELDRALRTKRGRFSEQTIGHYHLGDVLGRGAMGEVYAAVDTRNSSEVAVKLLSQLSLGNANHVLRFFRELRTAASVESSHVVRVIEIGEQPVPYLVMERLEGQTLAEILRERRTLPPNITLELVEQVGIGITAAGNAGIVHRDLKPQNIFRHHDAWKILDFGVARAMDHGDTLTAGHLIGTPSYMAPEQASGGAVDHRTDLYALAAVAYRALTGHPPFASGDIAETVYRVVHTRPIRPTLLAPELSGDVDLVFAIGLAHDAADRFANAADLAAALRTAFARELSPALRARGHAIVDRAPWSTGRERPGKPSP